MTQTHRTAVRRLAACALFLGLPVFAFAQQIPIERRLPADAWACVVWHGTASLGSAGQSNSLLQLWADPGFAPLRQLLTGELYRSARPDAVASLSPEELTQLLLVFENQFAAGILPGSRQGAGSEPELDFSGRNPASYFLIVDVTGKIESLTKLGLRTLPQGTKNSTTTRYAFGTTTIEKFAGMRSTYYQAFAGNYYFRSDRSEVVEELVTRFRSQELPTTSLGETPLYRQVRKKAGEGGALELFVRMPDFTKLPTPPDKTFDSNALVRDLNLAQFRALGGNLRFGSAETRARVVTLGDTSGGILGLLGPKGREFATLRLALPTTSYSASRFDLAGAYRMLRKALADSLPHEQAAKIDFFEGMAQVTLGMPPGDALELFTGEFASITSPAPGSLPEILFAATIQQPEKIIQVVQTIQSFQAKQSGLTWEKEAAGDTTYFKLSRPGAGSQAASTVFSMALTPHMLLASARESLVREAVTRLAPDAGNALALDSRFLQNRKGLPEDLSSLSYADLTQLQWDKGFDPINKAIASLVSGSMDNSERNLADKLRHLDTAVFSRHLHTATSGSWKDPDGIYFEWILQ
jgi:hypothetical protein